MKKILLIQPTINQSGGGAIAQQFIKVSLEKLKFDVHSISFCGTQLENKQHYTRDLISKYPKRFYKYSYINEVCHFLNLTIKDVKPDIIIVGQIWSYFSILLCLLKYRRIPKIHIIHTAELICLNSFLTKKKDKQQCEGKVGIKCIQNNCVSRKSSLFIMGLHYILLFSIKKTFDHFICHSEYMKTLLKRNNITNVTLIPLSIPENITIPAEKENSIVNFTKLLFVGSLEWHKGIEVLIYSLLILMERTTKFHLTIIGEGSLKKRLFQIILKNSLTEFVTFEGAIERSELFDYYQQSDIIVFPSYFETFGLVALEAIIFNKKIVLSNRGALPEVVFGYPNSVIINAINPLDLANGIFKSINSIQITAKNIHILNDDHLSTLKSVINNLI